MAAALTRFLRGGAAAVLRRIPCSTAPHSPSTSPFPDLRLFSHPSLFLRSLTLASAAPSGEEHDGSSDSSASAKQDPSQYPEMLEGDWICPKCSFMNFSRNLRCRECKADGPNGSGSSLMRSGDWTCPSCNFMNFARNKRCLRCMVNRPGYTPTDNVEVKKGDWNCPECNNFNFSQNATCRRCNATRGITFGSAPFKQFDWNCPKCQYVNFARNSSCLRCQEPRSKVPLVHGDWECPSCRFLNFSRNLKCRDCNHPCPEDSTSRQENNFLQMPAVALEETLKVSDDDSGDEDIDSLIQGLYKLEDKRS